MKVWLKTINQTCHWWKATSSLGFHIWSRPDKTHKTTLKYFFYFITVKLYINICINIYIYINALKNLAKYLHSVPTLVNLSIKHHILVFFQQFNFLIVLLPKWNKEYEFLKIPKIKKSQKILHYNHFEEDAFYDLRTFPF